MSVREHDNGHDGYLIKTEGATRLIPKHDHLYQRQSQRIASFQELQELNKLGSSEA